MEAPPCRLDDLYQVTRAEQARALYGQGPTALATAAAIGVLLVLALPDPIPTHHRLGWLAVVLALTAVRFALIADFHRSDGDPGRWIGRWIGGALANGFVWGAGTLLFFTEAMEAQVLLAFVVGGLSAGAASSAASSRASFLAFAVPAVAPLVVRMAATGQPDRMLMAGMGALFALAMTALATRSSRSFEELIRYRLETETMAEELRRQSADALARFRALFDQAAGIILVAEAETWRVVDLGSATAGRLGVRSPDGLPPLDQIELLRGLHQGAWRDLVAQAEAAGSASFEGTDGDRVIELTVHVVEIRERRFILGVGRDVTDRKALQSELTQARLLASVGRLAAGVGHEINNPLAAVVGNLEYLEEDCLEALPQDGRVAVQDALTAAQRIRGIVAKLSRLDRVPGDPKAVALAPILTEAADLAKNVIRHRARFEVQSATESHVFGEPALLLQVFFTLLAHAVQAVEEAGPGSHCVSMKVFDSKDDDRVRVEVEDTGRGLSSDLERRLFEPFSVVTREEGGGLGLAVAQQAMRSLGGRLELERPDGGGNRFVVHLPRVAEPGSQPG